MDEIIADVLKQAIELVPWVGVLVVVGLLFWPKLIEFLTIWIQQGQQRYDGLTNRLDRVEQAITALSLVVSQRQAEQIACTAELTADVMQLTGAMRDLSDDMRALMITAKPGGAASG